MSLHGIVDFHLWYIALAAERAHRSVRQLYRNQEIVDADEPAFDFPSRCKRNRYGSRRRVRHAGRGHAPSAAAARNPDSLKRLGVGEFCCQALQVARGGMATAALRAEVFLARA